MQLHEVDTSLNGIMEKWNKACLKITTSWLHSSHRVVIIKILIVTS